MHLNSKKTAYLIPLGLDIPKHKSRRVAGGLLSIRLGKGRFFARPVPPEAVPVHLLNKPVADRLKTVGLPYGTALVSVKSGAVKRTAFQGAQELLNLVMQRASSPVAV